MTDERIRELEAEVERLRGRLRILDCDAVEFFREIGTLATRAVQSEAQRDELLEALRRVAEQTSEATDAHQIALAAIARVER